jgi:hypothetical protein
LEGFSTPWAGVG